MGYQKFHKWLKLRAPNMNKLSEIVSVGPTHVSISVVLNRNGNKGCRNLNKTWMIVDDLRAKLNPTKSQTILKRLRYLFEYLVEDGGILGQLGRSIWGILVHLFLATARSLGADHIRGVIPRKIPTPTPAPDHPQAFQIRFSLRPFFVNTLKMSRTAPSSFMWRHGLVLWNPLSPKEIFTVKGHGWLGGSSFCLGGRRNGVPENDHRTFWDSHMKSENVQLLVRIWARLAKS